MTQPRTLRTLRIVAVAVVVLLAAGGGYMVARLGGGEVPTTSVPPTTSATTAGGTITISGLLRVQPTFVKREIGKPCITTGGYDDIAAGTQVSVTDPSGKVVALGELGRGYVNPVLESDTLLIYVPGMTACAFMFEVAAPAGLGTYGIEVAHRGVVHFDEDELLVGIRLDLG